MSSIFSTLSDLDMVDFNFIKELRTKKVTQKQSAIPSDGTVIKALELLKEQNETLLLYIYFVSYMFWRPIEIVRLKIDNIDFEKGTIFATTKTKNKKVKIIPDIIKDDIINYVKGRTGNVFYYKSKNDTHRRNFLTKRFRNFRKRNNLPESLTPYSFRHYFITKIYKELRKELNKEDTVKKLSLITGHDSKAIYHYIHVNDLELPDDYSDLLK